jgi:hypothetical protein
LKTAPAADIVDKDCAIGWGSDHISQKLLKTRSTLKHKAAFPGIGICTDDLETSGGRVRLDCGRLVFERILLVFGRHAKVLSSGNKQIGSHVALLREDIDRIPKNFSRRYFGSSD